MDWLRVTILCEAAAIEDVCACLTIAGAQEQEIIDDWNSVLAELESSSSYWDYIDENEVMAQKTQPCVRVYVANDESGRDKLKDITSEIEALRNRKIADVNYDRGQTNAAQVELQRIDSVQYDPQKIQITTSIVREEDWANIWKQYYKPMPIGDKLLIMPEWEDSVPEDHGRLVLKMEPGLVFGTGEHQSTQLCLASLEKYIEPDMRILDLGCGSGILSIAALLLGAKNALAIDIDPNAMSSATENAKRNGMDESQFRVLIGDVLQSDQIQKEISNQSYGVIVANIVADVIIALLPYVGSWLKKDGVFICSGIISQRLDDVVNSLEENNFKIISTIQKDDWHCIHSALITGS